MSRRIALAWLGLAACAPARITLDAPAGWASALLAIDADGRRELRAIAGAPEVAIEPPEGEEQELVALFYASPLVELAVPEGVFEPGLRAAPAGELRGLALAWSGGSAGPAEPLGPADPRRDRVLLPDLTPPLCGAIGRCLELDAASRACVEGCEPPAIERPAPPAPPAPPVLTPCPPAWVEREGACEPPSLPARAVCGPGQAQARAASTCAALGPACPAGLYASDVPSGAVFVDPLGRPGPGGEPSSLSIADALASAGPGAVLLLSRAEHVLSGPLLGATLRGACVAESVVDHRGPAITSGRLEQLTLRRGAASVGVDVAAGSTVAISRASVEGGGLRAFGRLALEDVTVGGASVAQLISAPEGSVRLSRVTLDHGRPRAIVLGSPRASLEADELVLGSTASTSLAIIGGRARVTHARFVGAAVSVMAGGHAELVDVTFEPGPGGSAPTALSASEGAELLVERVGIEARSRAVSTTRSSLQLRDAWIEGSSSALDPLVSISDSSTLAATRALLASPGRIGLELAGTSSASITDLIVRGAGVTEGGSSYAVVSQASRLRAARIAVFGAKGSALALITGTATVSDLTVEDVSDGNAGEGRALDSADARFVLERVVVRRSEVYGSRFFRSRGTLRDFEIIGAVAVGFNITDGEYDVSRVRVRDVPWRAISMGGSRVTARDLEVFGGGSAIVVQRGDVSLERVRLDHTLGQALELREGSTVRGRAIEIDGVGTTGTDLGYAVFVLNGTHAELSGSVFRGAAESIIHVESRADLEPRAPVVRVSDSLFADTPFGVFLMDRGNVPAEVELSGVRLRGVERERGP